MSEDHKAKGYHSKSEMKRVETLKAVKEAGDHFNGYYRDEEMSRRVFDWIKSLEREREQAIDALKRAEIALAKYKQETRVGSEALGVVRGTLKELGADS